MGAFFDPTELALEVLLQLNKSETPAQAIDGILKIIKRHTGASAVGIRLRDGEDFPYFSHYGFTEKHVEAENLLCALDKSANPKTDEHGQPLLECMCGRVIRSRVHPDKPYFTAGGSFYTNNLKKLVEDDGEELELRDVCFSEKYESIILIPLKSRQEIVGLIQLNDHSSLNLNLPEIEYLEALGESIGVALSHLQEENRRKEAEQEREKVLRDLEIRVSELDLLYNVSKLLDKPDLTPGETLQGVIDLIPSGFQYPEEACARISIGDQSVQTGNFKQTKWMLSLPLFVYGVDIGVLEVCYLNEKPQEQIGPFLSDELRMMETLRESITALIEKNKEHEWEKDLNRYALVLKNDEVVHLWKLVKEDLEIDQIDRDAFISLKVDIDKDSQNMETWLHLNMKMETNKALMKKLQSLLMDM